jgi:glycine betaine transporter
LAFVFLASSPWEIVKNFGIALQNYVVDFIPMSLALDPFDPGIAFLTEWTFYYWAFWLAWAPFTGIFIARISKGRTLRQLLLGVLLIPSLGTFFWFSVFGTSAFELIEVLGPYSGQYDNVFNSLFIFLEHYPLSGLMNIISSILLVGFLVTSVDSAVFVLSMFTDGGKKDPAKSHRLIWSVFILVATIALLLLGNAKPGIDVLVAAQKLLIITSLPFSFFMVFIAYVFLRDLFRKDQRQA